MAETAAHGLLARFATPEALEKAVTRARRAGYREIEAFAPVPLPAVEESLGLDERKLPLIALAAAVVGGGLAYALQYYSAVHGYPFVVGGKPLHAWPPFLLVSVAVALLSAVVATLVSLLALCRYPLPYHPVFNVESFVRASSDGFFLLVASKDPAYEAEDTRAFLEDLGAASVEEVPP